ncbi:nuclear cap-binding protein subunit 3-like isoform X2 [Mercenaria mercenaria]|uniref:nuclear cap-binding protein subunit 3-like isoform X2 n=1 Tax=Mercenaria mercenaria TaxID=6596 RepID=UPI00234F522F|nr:nuclear cap-binding protein subunit 3-like isoform X2 [Mercenaria mercenaria]
MASTEKTKLPNLKICIDNDESESDDDNLSLTGEPQISLEEGEIDKRVTNPVHEEILVPESPGSERATGAEDDVQFNVYLNKLETKQVENSINRPTRRYENKEGNFVTGIDFTEQDTAEKLQERAKRFGIDYKPEPAVNLGELYQSLGLKAEDLNPKDERGIRIDAVHIRGVNEMNTKDVFNYFQEFAAGSCEWIDDESCNVVWLDKMTAARALLKLSRSYEQVMADFGLKVPINHKADKNKAKIETTSESKMDDDGTEQNNEKVGEKESEEERNEEKMEEDNDDLDLTEETKPEENKAEENKSEENKIDEEKMEDEGIEEGEITDSDSESEVQSKNQNAFDRIRWPPGKWRLGVPYKNKANYIFLRFATKADVKLPGAEKRSKYYQKYGNPNYGGRVGLLSRSMKQKLRARRDNDDFDRFGVPESGIVVTDRNQVSYGDDLFSDAVTPVEVEEIDLYSTSQKLGKKLKKPEKAQSEDEEEEMYQSEEENDFPVIERVMTNDREEDRATDSDVDEEELERLLRAKEKKPVMRMYADELEEKQKVNRQRQMVGALTIVADAKKKVKTVKDARQLITGVDLRKALQEKKMNRQRSPVSWKRSKSRSLSPDFERDMGGGMNFKIIQPMHMTIENEVMSETEEVKEISPEPEPEPVKEVKRKKRTSSPLGTKSKMDEIEKPKDVRSRLSKKARDDLDVRTARRSPNNVRSRLSKRVSPVNESPERFGDTRISRVRRSRSHDLFRSKFNRSRSPVNRNRRPVRRRSRTRSPVWRRNNNRYRSPVRNRSPFRRSPIRRFNRSRSRSPINRRPARSNIRSRSPVNRRFSDRTRTGRDARSRLGRKSRSPTDTENESDDEQIAPSRIKMTVAASSSSSSSSSSSDSSSNDSSSSSDSDSSSSSSSSDSSSSSSDSESDSDASERSAIRNKKTQRKIDHATRQQDKFAGSRKQHLSRRDSKTNGPRRKGHRPVRPADD